MLAPEAVKVVEPPIQMATSLPPLTVGRALTVTTTWSVFTQPFASVPVSVYVVVAVGLAVIEAPVVALKPVAGDHV